LAAQSLGCKLERMVERMEQHMVEVEVEDMAHMVGRMEVELEHMVLVVVEVLDTALEDKVRRMVDMADIDYSCRS